MCSREPSWRQGYFPEAVYPHGGQRSLPHQIPPHAAEIGLGLKVTRCAAEEEEMEERDTAITKESNYGETERDKMFTTVLRIEHWWCCHVWFESSEKSEDEFC